VITFIPHERLSIRRVINVVPEAYCRSRVDYTCEIDGMLFHFGPLWGEYDIPSNHLEAADALAIHAFEKKEKP
jgi:hypothetical protein